MYNKLASSPYGSEWQASLLLGRHRWIKSNTCVFIFLIVEHRKARNQNAAGMMPCSSSSQKMFKLEIFVQRNVSLVCKLWAQQVDKLELLQLMVVWGQRWLRLAAFSPWLKGGWQEPPGLLREHLQILLSFYFFPSALPTGNFPVFVNVTLLLVLRSQKARSQEAAY